MVEPVEEWRAVAQLLPHLTQIDEDLEIDEDLGSVVEHYPL
jgi:hypothetical protein